MVRGFDIGSAKPTAAELSETPHFLINNLAPNESYNVKQFLSDVEMIRAQEETLGRKLILVGGTGFYIRALLYGLWDAPETNLTLREELSRFSEIELFQKLLHYSEEFRSLVKPQDKYRVTRLLEILQAENSLEKVLENLRKPKPKANSSFKLIVIKRGSEEMNARISQRTRLMLDAGWVQETEKLIAEGAKPDYLNSVGYREICTYLNGELKSEELPERIHIATRQLVKKQLTFARGQFTNDATWFELDWDLESCTKAILDCYGDDVR